MKINSLCFAVLVATTASSVGVSGVSWPKWGSSSSNKNNDDEKHVVATTVVNNDTIENIIHKEKRYVLYNSRRLTGECLPICYDPDTDPTPSPIQTLPPFSETITEKPVGIETSAPIATPETDAPVHVPETDAPVHVPETDAPVGTPTGGGGVICEDFTEHNNLGYPFSQAVGDNHWDGECFPPVHSLSVPPRGFDDAIAVFIGGSYTGILGAEIEGNIVVLGDFSIQSEGPRNLISAGEGTQITPNFGGKCVQVGGSMTTAKRLEVYFQEDRPSYKCQMVSKGEARNVHKFPDWQMNSPGFAYESDPNLDLSQYEEQKENLIAKSEYWSTFSQTPGATAGLSGNVFTFTCSADDVIQVFHVQSSVMNSGNLGSYLFGDNCHDKTILINVHGTGTYNVKAKTMDWTDGDGDVQEGGHEGFDSCMNSNILWNFFETDTMKMVGDGEWQGSILVNGNFHFKTIGQSGRTMVVGDVIQDRYGSEFHSFEFKPPKPLPSPDCDDFVPSNPVADPTFPPVGLPDVETDAPVHIQETETVAPVAPTNPPASFDPGNFCHNLGVQAGCNMNRPGSCQINPGPNGEPSCGAGVPSGYYPDLTRCDAYCFCTGTAAPSRYEIVGEHTYWDHKIPGKSYLNGKYGKDEGNGAYGTEGGQVVHINGGMSNEGTQRPPGTCGPRQTCRGPNDNNWYPWDSCRSFYRCVNGSPQQVQPCPVNTLWDTRYSTCAHANQVNCEI